MFKNYWNNNGLEILAMISFIIIIILFIYNCFSKKKGSYSKVYGDFVSNQNIPKDSFFNYRQHTMRDSKLELLTKYHLENLFRKSFYKIRPNFLKNNKTGRNLEIDLFNKELNLAVEIQGIQHYKFTPKFHLSEKHFIEQKQRDYMKKERCQQYGIKLIEIPYYIKEKDLQSFLIKRLQEERLI